MDSLPRRDENVCWHPQVIYAAAAVVVAMQGQGGVDMAVWRRRFLRAKLVDNAGIGVESVGVLTDAEGLGVRWVISAPRSNVVAAGATATIELVLAYEDYRWVGPPMVRLSGWAGWADAYIVLEAVGRHYGTIPVSDK